VKERARELAEILTQGLVQDGMPELFESAVYTTLSDVLSSDRFRAFLAAHDRGSADQILDKLVLRFDPKDFRVDLEYKN
jgi:hypothetical protein